MRTNLSVKAKVDEDIWQDAIKIIIKNFAPEVRANVSIDIKDNVRSNIVWGTVWEATI